MGKRGMTLKTILIICVAAFSLSACGGGGGTGAATPAPATTTQAAVVEGIAATGAPLTGAVSLSDSSNPAIEVTAPINRDGTFSIDVSGRKAPFILKAADASGNVLYSFAKAPGTANINPLTNLSVAVAAGAADMQDLANTYNIHNNASMQVIANGIDNASADISSTLQPLLSLYGAETADPLYGLYFVNKQGLDGLYEQVTCSISGSMVTISRKDGVLIFAAPAGAVSSGTVISGNLPTPQVYGMPGNAVLTLRVDGELPQGTLIKNVSLSVQLPLGVTVAIDNSDPSGSASACNTAIPTVGAAGANVYPAPTLSATNNILTVSMSSLAGFATGEFLTIRLLISTSSLMDATTPNSFSVTSSSFFADIYKNQKLKGLTISPVSLVYPTREGRQAYDSLCARCHTLDQSDSVITPTLYKKTSLVAERLKTTHHGVTLSSNDLEYLQEYMTAYFIGQWIF